MKKTKTLLALTLILVLMLSVGTCAFAADAKFASTQKYVDAMAELDGATCEVQANTVEIGSTYEVVKVDYEGELSKYKNQFNVGFTENSQEILMSTSIMNYDPEKFSDVLAAVNDINAAATTVKLYVDTDRNVVVGELYLLATEDSLLEIALTGTGIFIGYTDSVFEELSDYVV